MEIKELIKFVSEIEKKELKNYSNENNHYDIAPVDSEGDPLNDATARPTIVFKVLKDEVILQWLYLNNQNQGLGSKIVQWVINYAKSKEIKKVSIRLVNKNNIAMLTLAGKFGFCITTTNESYLNYELIL